MWIAPLYSLWIDGSLGRKHAPFLVLYGKLLCKHSLLCITRAMHKFPQLDARLKVRSPCEIRGDNCLLVEVAHLHGDIPVKMLQPWLSVGYNSSYYMAQGLKRVMGTLALLKYFTLYFGLEPIPKLKCV